MYNADGLILKWMEYYYDNTVFFMPSKVWNYHVKDDL